VTDLFPGHRDRLFRVDASGREYREGEDVRGAAGGGGRAGLAGIDVRLFGFTDHVIYDAGDATRCAVHGLRADGGNNDAAGLWHAAQTALASRRKAKLLVMISDGLPTQCTVERCAAW